MKRGNLIIFTLFFVLLILVIFCGCSKRPQSSQPPSLPIFDEFSITFPKSIINTQEGVKQAEFHLALTNLLFNIINTIVTSAEGPTRIGLSSVWVSEVGEATYIIDGQLGIKGYNWIITTNGTDLLEYYYENEKTMDGSSNFTQTHYIFNIYDPEKPPGELGILADYSNDGGKIRLLGKIYDHINLGVHSKMDIEQNSSGTGHVISYWDTNHIWPESSKYLELYWWDTSSSTAEQGSWQTWWVPGIESVGSFGTITNESGAW